MEAEEFKPEPSIREAKLHPGVYISTLARVLHLFALPAQLRLLLGAQSTGFWSPLFFAFATVLVTLSATMHPCLLRVAVVCSNNQNRSMEAHRLLKKRGFIVKSFGTGTRVCLPGPTPDNPNVYNFKTTYNQMYCDLLKKDKELYTSNGILNMLGRNRRIKPRPERFQNCKEVFDLIFTCEERVYDNVVEELNSRDQETFKPVHVINVDIQDNEEEATLGAFLICELCECIQQAEDMENEIDDLLQEFEEQSGRTFLHTVCFY
ncbi:RNA polymerase II subunit A C-terminal domain phosphatase SSU72-like [Dromiciops gliroides]|uniref:RNA polymerase II subunit A C-terminal domain phosphatase SSU72-like n=1 Tax=Dromiciops gliroides TaxID=33562 RepID=UPI001CC79605|nr:RNA polymerase II subunit A C-terminal domain phosphatase SSU72-like [Dromiciops gliroides]